MIIKKKYTNIAKPQEEEKTEEMPVISEYDGDIFDNSEEAPEETEENKETPQEAINDFDLTLESIKFEPRSERREGTRRRGYRRSNERNLISRAQSEAIGIKEAAKQDGYKEGIEKAEQDIAELRTKFSEFYNYKNEVFEKISHSILEIAVEIAKKIIKKEVQTDTSATIEIIKSALEEVNKSENKIVLRVMPKDVEIVKDNIPEIFKDNEIEAKISVVADNNITEGGVIIETSNGLTDASISTQLAIIEKALRNGEGI